MGGAQSTPEPVAALRAKPRHQQSRQSEATTYTTLDEKFDAVRIDTKRPRNTYGNVLDDTNHGHVSVSKTEEYVREVLRDDKNRLGLSTFTTTNPISVLKRPSVLLKDTQFFNVTIPLEGSPVTNQRSSGRCWIFAACKKCFRENPSPFLIFALSLLGVAMSGGFPMVVSLWCRWISRGDIVLHEVNRLLTRSA